MDFAANVENPVSLPSTQPYQIQNFSLPSTIIYLILKNPSSPKFLQKLYSTCKYFFAKQPILIFTEIFFYNYDLRKCINSRAMRWYNDELYISTKLFQNTSKVYRCTIHTLSLLRTIISLQDFQVLVAENTVKNCEIDESEIFYSDKSIACIDGILENLPNIIKFNYSNEKDIFDMKTLKKLNSLKFWNKFEMLKLDLYHIVVEITLG